MEPYMLQKLLALLLKFVAEYSTSPVRIMVSCAQVNINCRTCGTAAKVAATGPKAYFAIAADTVILRLFCVNYKLGFG